MPRIKERRRRQRVDVALPIEIKYNRKRIKTLTKNISILGAYIEINQEIPMGTTLDIKVKIPKKISCTGAVFRCQGIGSFEPKERYGIGIFFRAFLESGEKDLAGYIDRILLQEKRKGKIYMRKRTVRKAKRKGGKR